MNTKVLVAYASKYGATEEIAERIGLTLSRNGFIVDVLPVDEVSNLKHYEAIVLGSAVYVGQWRRQAARFLKKNAKMLSKKLVWLFSSGPTGDGNPVDLMKGWHFPLLLQQVADRIKPCDIAFFHGEVNMEKVNFLERFVINKIHVSTGDFRNWGDIEAWADNISKQLQLSASEK
jgi:menaquinone-dependent protoporphyrinogen oxidase